MHCKQLLYLSTSSMFSSTEKQFKKKRGRREQMTLNSFQLQALYGLYLYVSISHGNG